MCPWRSSRTHDIRGGLRESFVKHGIGCQHFDNKVCLNFIKPITIVPRILVVRSGKHVISTLFKSVDKGITKGAEIHVKN